MTALVEGMRSADRAGAFTGEGIKSALDSGKPIDLGGVAAPVAYSPTDHRSSDVTYVYRIDATRKPVLVGEVKLERRAEWLGH